MVEVPGRSIEQETLNVISRNVEVLESKGLRGLEIDGQGEILWVSLQGAKEGSHLPLLIVGKKRIEEAEKIVIWFPGIGVPSLKTIKNGKEVISHSHLPVAGELLKQDGSLVNVFLLNWPGYGQDELESKLDWNIPTHSLPEKGTIMVSITDWLVKRAENAEAILIDGHSAAGGVLLRLEDQLINNDDRRLLIASSPSGIGADSASMQRYGRWSRGGGRPLKVMMRFQKEIPVTVKTALLASGYGLPDWQVKNDPWLQAISDETPPEVIVAETAAEEKALKLLEIKRNPRRMVIVPLNDPLVDWVKIKSLLEDENDFDLLPPIGHLGPRHPNGPEVLARVTRNFMRSV